jgi:type IV pilus assembly protein PilB
MVDMGIPSYLVASSVISVLAQRLVRTICPKCKQPFTPKDAELEAAGITPDAAKTATFFKGKGCGSCQRTGYRGRTGIHELMIISQPIREMIFEGKSSADIRKIAMKQGMKTLYVDGIEKVMKGITTFEEVFRNAKRTEQDQILPL